MSQKSLFRKWTGVRAASSVNRVLALQLVLLSLVTPLPSAQFRFVLLTSFAPPCRDIAGIGLVHDGLAVLCEGSDSLFVVDKSSGVVQQSVAVADTSLGYLAADSLGQLYAWRRADAHIYRVSHVTGAIEVLNDTLRSSRVFGCDGENVYLRRFEGSMAEELRRVSLSTGVESKIDWGEGGPSGYYQDRYFWHLFTYGPEAGMDVFDLTIPPNAFYWWAPMLGDEDLALPCHDCWGLARRGDTLWTYSPINNAIMQILVTDTTLSTSVQTAYPTIMSTRTPGRATDIRGRRVNLGQARAAGLLVMTSKAGSQLSVEGVTQRVGKRMP
jgi:hypothetical protein